jgi:hypothetical protein
MTRLFGKTAIGVSLALCAFVVPGQAVTISLSTSGGAGTFGNGAAVTVGTPFNLNSLSGILYTAISVFGDAVSADNGNFTLTDGGAITSNCSNGGGATLQRTNSTTLQLWGAITGSTAMSNLSSGCNLLFTFNNSAGWKGTADTSTHANVFLNNATSLSESSILLSDLSLFAGTLPANLVAGSTIGGTGTASSGNFTANSEQITFSLTNTPEPFSFFLMGSGLLAVVFFARKKSSVTEPRA